MSTFAVGVIVVGACIGVVASVVTRSMEPATDSARDKRGPAPLLRAPDATTVSATPAVVAAALEEQPVAPAMARVEQLPDGEPNVPLRWWQRLRSLLLLSMLAVVLGVLAAAAVGLVVVALFGLLRGAVG